MEKLYGILLTVMLLCIGCQWQLKPNDEDDERRQVSIQRYDRIESNYLSTGDYAALQQMNIVYPKQTRMLIEDVLRLGQVNDEDINTKFLYFFQDSTLQTMLTDVQEQYADMDDVSEELAFAFERLKEELPDMEIPVIYTQIGSFDQSIVVGNNTLGISLDKYLGSDYPFYVHHYTPEQRSLMERSMIVPDCLAFYILSLFPLTPEQLQSQQCRDIHMGMIQWVVNKVLDKEIFKNMHVASISEYMRVHAKVTIAQLLRHTDYSVFRKN